MQLHWISLIPVIVLLKNRRIGLSFIKFIIVATIAISCWTIYIKKLPPGSVITSNKYDFYYLKKTYYLNFQKFVYSDFVDENAMPKDYLQFVYKPWTHAYVFFIGFLFVYYIKNNSKLIKQITLSKVLNFNN